MEYRLLGLIILIICGGIVGWYANEIHDVSSYQRQLDGFNFRNANIQDIEDYQQIGDKYGDWVCVNIREMDYDRALEVCQHEVGHEIFAEVCEKNISRCLDVVNHK